MLQRVLIQRKNTVFHRFKQQLQTIHKMSNLVKVLESHTRLDKMAVINRLKIAVVQAKQQAKQK